MDQAQKVVSIPARIVRALHERTAAIENLSRAMAEQHNADGGCTFSHLGVEFTSGKGWGVGCGAGKGDSIAGRFFFTSDVAKWLRKVWYPGLYFGSWYDRLDGRSFLDVTEIYPSMKVAAELGQQRGERYLWDFANGREVLIENIITGTEEADNG